MPPVISFAGRETEPVAFGGDAEAEHGAVGIGEIGHDLIHFQYFTVRQSPLAKDIEGGRGHLGGAAGEGCGIMQDRARPLVEAIVEVVLSERRADGSGTGPVIEQSAKPGEVMFHAIGTSVKQAYVDPDRLEQPHRQGIAAVMEDIFVEGHVASQGMRAQAMHLHDVVDGIPWPFDAIVELLQLAGG